MDRFTEESRIHGAESHPMGAPNKGSTTVVPLVQNLIHKLAQPLSSINNYAGTCRILAAKNDSPPMADVARFASKITTEVMRANEVVSLLRTILVRLVDGHEPCDLDALVNDVLWVVGVSASQTWIKQNSTRATIDSPVDVQWALSDIMRTLAVPDQTWDVSWRDPVTLRILAEGASAPWESSTADYVSKIGEKANIHVQFCATDDGAAVEFRFDSANMDQTAPDAPAVL